MKIAIASDHAGFTYKSEIIKHLKAQGYEVIDFGTDSERSVDYPDFIKPAAQSVINGQSDAAIVLGGSGNGEAIAANKVAGIRCAVCWSTETADLAKKHNNVNISVDFDHFSHRNILQRFTRFIVNLNVS